MEEQKHIKDYIVDYLLEEKAKKSIDPVLAEWLAEDESNRKEFDLYKKIWEESLLYTESGTFDSVLAWEKVNTMNLQKKKYRKYLRNISYTVSGAAASLVSGASADAALAGGRTALPCVGIGNHASADPSGGCQGILCPISCRTSDNSGFGAVR